MAFPHHQYSKSNRSGMDEDVDTSYSRSYSPLLQPQIRGKSPQAYGSPISSPPTKKSTILKSSSRSPKTSGNLLGISPPSASQVAWQSSVSPPRHAPASSFLLPPPAVTSYAYAQTKSLYDLQRSPLFQLQKQVKELTKELQELLDAQSAGLLMASGVRSSDKPREGSQDRLTSWDGDVTSSSILPKKPRISLKAARHGIVQAMGALADVKGMEEEVYSAEEAERLKNISQVEDWESKKQELTESIKDAEEGSDARRLVDLQKEREAVELEIRQVEEQLRSLKSHHSTLVSRISTLESSLSKRSTNYRNSLSSIKSSEKRFLASLPPTFRSPSHAVESWKAEVEALREKKEQAVEEKDALREGIMIWEEALVLVRGFEENFRRHLNPGTPASSGSKNMQLGKTNAIKDTMGLFETGSVVVSQRAPAFSSPSTYLHKSKSRPSSNSPSSRPRSSQRPQLQRFDSLISEDNDNEVPEHLFPRTSPKKSSPHRKGKHQREFTTIEQKILTDIEYVLQKLEEKVNYAESKNWKLLVCCLAAEAQAFREAKEIMLRKISEQEKEKVTSPTDSARIDDFLGGGEAVEVDTTFNKLEIGSGRIRASQLGENQTSTSGINYGDMNEQSKGGFGQQGEKPKKFVNRWHGTVEDFRHAIAGIGQDIRTQANTDVRQANQSSRTFGTEDIDLSSNQDTHHEQMLTSSSISPKAPSRRASISSNRARNLQKSKLEGGDAGDRNGWDRELGGIGDNGEEANDDEDDNSTVRGTGSIQFLKGPTVGQVMRSQGTISTSATNAAGVVTSVSNSPSGIALGLGTWGRMKKVTGGTHQRVNSAESSGGWGTQCDIRGGNGSGGNGNAGKDGGNASSPGIELEENLMIG